MYGLFVVNRLACSSYFDQIYHANCFAIGNCPMRDSLSTDVAIDSITMPNVILEERILTGIVRSPTQLVVFAQ